MDNSRLPVLVLASVFLAFPLHARDFYVTPAGTAEGDGTMQKPWSLQKALSNSSAAKPGDTIWLRAGTYTGNWTNSLRGAPRKPIVVRQYPGERVTLDGIGSDKTPTLTVVGAYTWFWGFEITNSDPARAPLPTGESPPRGPAVHLLSKGSKLI